MKFRKVLCGSLAALMAMSTTAIVAQAEDAADFKLLTATLNELASPNATFIRGGYYFSDGKFYRIGSDELAKWRETGKIAYSTVESDFDVSGLTWWTGDFDGGYAQFVKKDSAGNITERYVLSVDKAANKVNLAYTLPANWAYTNSDGYTLSDALDGKNYSVIVYDTSGKKSSETVALFTENDWRNISSKGGKNVGYFAMTTEEEKNSGGVITTPQKTVYAVKRDGTIKAIDSDYSYDVSFDGANENCSLFFYNDIKDTVSSLKIYSIDNDKVYKICTGRGFSNGTETMIPNTLGSKIYGSKVVLGMVLQLGSKYAIVELRDGEEAKLISKTYKSMTTNDGEIYCVQTQDDKWGYIDSNGKELAMFDDAGDFIGDYAPVVKNGKGYLIDRKMNKVSDEIDAESVINIYEKDLFAFVSNEEAILATYVNKSESKPDDTSSEPTSSEPTSSEPTSSEPASSEPTSSEPTSSEPTSSEPASSDTVSSGASGGNDNPNSGAAMALIPAALIGGAAVVVSKKRKR